MRCDTTAVMSYHISTVQYMIPPYHFAVCDVVREFRVRSADSGRPGVCGTLTQQFGNSIAVVVQLAVGGWESGGNNDAFTMLLLLWDPG